MTPTVRSLAAEWLEAEEGRRRFAYTDTVGKLSIGIGHNLTDRGLSNAAIDFIFHEDLDRAEADLLTLCPWAADLDPVRYTILLDMCFNLGRTRLAGFVHTLSLIRDGHYTAAAEAMLASKWATQVGDRARTLAQRMRTGIA